MDKVEKTTKYQLGGRTGKGFMPGKSGNPAGRPKGSPNFSTKFKQLIDRVAADEQVSSEEIEERLIEVGYKGAKSGDYKFWKDIHDRVYGQATQNLNIDGKLEIDELSREKAKKALRDI
jgi:hypothetical protein